jgi:tetratricopeptide (TPR) repeat protein
VAHGGDLVGPYRLIRELGGGGMGTVWLAERADGRFKRQVALKLPRLAWGAGLARRMARERDIDALLQHPNIARLYDAGVDDRGRPCLALAYIDGQPIDARCRIQGLGVRAQLGLFVQVARAVADAHGRLVVHRDLKPSNVLVTREGQAHLLDFGIAKLLDDGAADDDVGLTQQQGRVLTPHYASPEQVAGAAITVQSDVYSASASWHGPTAWAGIVKAFVIEVFKVNERGNPTNPELRSLPAELLLERGASLIETRFAGQADLQAELYGVGAQILLDMGAAKSAVDFATRQLAAQQADGASATERAQGLLLMGEALTAVRRLSDAQQRASAALALAPDDPALRLRAHLLMADAMIQDRRPNDALAALDRADAVLAWVLPQAGLKHARAAFLRASALDELGRHNLSQPLLRRSVAQADAEEPAPSSLAARIRIRLASSLVVGLSADEVERIRVQGVASVPGAAGAAGQQTTCPVWTRGSVRVDGRPRRCGRPTTLAHGAHFMKTSNPHRVCQAPGLFATRAAMAPGVFGNARGGLQEPGQPAARWGQHRSQERHAEDLGQQQHDLLRRRLVRGRQRTAGVGRIGGHLLRQHHPKQRRAVQRHGRQVLRGRLQHRRSPPAGQRCGRCQLRHGQLLHRRHRRPGRGHAVRPLQLGRRVDLRRHLETGVLGRIRGARRRPLRPVRLGRRKRQLLGHRQQRPGAGRRHGAGHIAAVHRRHGQRPGGARAGARVADSGGPALDRRATQPLPCTELTHHPACGCAQAEPKRSLHEAPMTSAAGG